MTWPCRLLCCTRMWPAGGLLLMHGDNSLPGRRSAKGSSAVGVQKDKEARFSMPANQLHASMQSADVLSVPRCHQKEKWRRPEIARAYKFNLGRGRCRAAL